MSPLTWPGLPVTLMLPLMIIAGFLGGGLWAGICGYLRAKGLLSEVLSTLLMNSVAGFWLQYLVFGVWHDPKSSNFPQSKPYPNAAVLPHIWSGRLHVGFFLALAGVALFWFVLYKTRWGYEMRAIGGNPEAAKRSGIPINWYIVLLFVIGGGIAGIGGMAETSAIQGRLRPGFSSSYGYIGFLISWMSGHNPVLIVVMSFLLAVITSGRDVLQITQNLPGAAVNILMALILFVVLARRGKKGGKNMSTSFFEGVLSNAVLSGTSILYATVGEVIGERAGIVNLGLEGVMLVGAVTGFVVTAETQNPYVGVLAAAFGWCGIQHDLRLPRGHEAR